MNITGERLRLYAVTDRAWAVDQGSLFRQIEEAIDGGASIVQLREKRLDEALVNLVYSPDEAGRTG